MRLALAVGGSLLVACAGRFPRPDYSPQPTSALSALAVPPPPARVEAVPVRPNATAVWLDGEWTWRRGRWAWLTGRWVEPPPHETFSPWAVVRGLDGKLWMAPGTWRDAKGNPVDGPTPLAVGVVDSGQVVNAGGSIEPTGRTVKATSTKPSRAAIDPAAGQPAAAIEPAAAPPAPTKPSHATTTDPAAGQPDRVVPAGRAYVPEP